MKKWGGAALLAAVILALPRLAMAQGIAGSISGLQGVLDPLYSQMLPLCQQLIGVSRGIAGFAATWYIAYRVWGHIARAEPIDFYPLFRPFVLGFAILVFPSVIALINGVMQPVVAATAGMVKGSNQAITLLLQQRKAAIQQSSVWQMYVGASGSGNQEQWYKYTHPGDTSGTGGGLLSGIGNDVKFAMAKATYNFRSSIKEWLSEVLELIYEAAALCINTIRTFYLIVLAILGPLVFGLAVFDGFRHTLSVWLARYINVFLWLPVANIFGSILGQIQQEMLKLDISQVQSSGDTFFSSTDTAYLVFLMIAIAGYFTVPSVANFIVYAGGGNGLLRKVTTLSFGTAGAASNIVSGGAGMVAGALGKSAEHMESSVASYGVNSGWFPDTERAEKPGGYKYERLSGKD